MSFTEYANLTVPNLITKYIETGTVQDVVLSGIQKARKVVRSGGSKVQFRTVISGHSLATQPSASNLQVDLTRKTTFGTADADWARLLLPCIIAHTDINRMTDKSEVKHMVDAATRAMMTLHFNKMYGRFYNGVAVGTDTDLAAYNQFGTINGNNTSGTVSGLTAGAIQFALPAAQTGTYLNRARTVDANTINNWYNQYKQHAGIGVNALNAVREVALLADSFREKSLGTNGGFAKAVLPITDAIALSNEAQFLGGSGQSSVIYTAAEADAGKLASLIATINQIEFHGSRIMNGTTIGATQPIYLINPDCFEFWINQKLDMKSNGWFNGLATTGIDAEICIWEREVQIAVTDLVGVGAVSQ